jgi:DNA-binding GntR family transcriptional regulator
MRAKRAAAARRSASGPAPHENKTLAETAFTVLKRAILQGRFPEGQFLSEAQILKEYGIGRTPFREACNRLHHEELLEAVPRRGYLVPKMSFRQVRDFFEFRLLIEGTAAELAALRASADQANELLRLATPAPGAPGEVPFEQVIEANRAFHLAVARATGNQEILKLVTRILERNERVSYIELNTARMNYADLARMHVPIVEAIGRHEPAKARAAMVQDITDAQLSAFGRDFWSRDQEPALAGVAEGLWTADGPGETRARRH